ncbi:MAG: class I SAM-dependent methyltransferase [Proteobacteria bacterium]|nr:class I SAM-dependent methyltransferase [Pseudomonadota bacterium]
MATKNACVLALSVLMTSLVTHAAEYPLLTPADHYNWTDVMEVPVGTFEGNQVLHFTGKNKPYKNDPKAAHVVTQYFKGAKELDADADVLRFASDEVSITGGYYIELGVGTGRTINFLAALNPTKKVYGFDSFEGLPTDWDKGDKIFKAGMFGLKRKDAKIPLVKNVIVYKGLFKEILPKFKNQVLKNNAIALLHIDSDTYQSAKDSLNLLADNIQPGTVIVFDEFYNYPRFEEHEWKAFQEFIQERKLNVQYIAYNKMHEQVAIKII